MMANRKTIAKKMYNKFDGAISEVMMVDVVSLLCEQLVKKLANGESITIGGFGTLYIYKYPERNNVNIYTGENQTTSATLHIHFDPHKHFNELLQQKKFLFEKEKGKDK